MNFKSYSPKKKNKIDFSVIYTILVGVFVAVAWSNYDHIIIVDINNIGFTFFASVIGLMGIISFYRHLSSKKITVMAIINAICQATFVILISATVLFSLIFVLITYYPSPLHYTISHYKIVEKGPKLLRRQSICRPGIKIKDPDSPYWYLQCLRNKHKDVDPDKILIISKITPFGNYLENYFFIKMDH